MFFFLFTTVAAQLALIGKELVLVRLTKVSTLQGKIHAVNTEGVQQWTLETGKPLVSSYYSEKFHCMKSYLCRLLKGIKELSFVFNKNTEIQFNVKKKKGSYVPNFIRLV